MKNSGKEGVAGSKKPPPDGWRRLDDVE